MLRAIFISFAALAILSLSACSDGQSSAVQKSDYDTTKKMVLDILQTEDGKKALKELLADEQMKQQLVMQDDTVKKAVNEALVSDEGKQMWEKLFSDPTFVNSFAKSMATEHQKLMKELMKDPDYQKQILSLLKNPQMQEQMLNVMQSQKFRDHLQDTVKETLQSPTFQAKMTETLLKAAEEQGQQKQGKGDKGNKGDNASEEGIG